MTWSNQIRIGFYSR